MKKIIAGSLIGCALFVSGTFANADVEVTSLNSTSLSKISVEDSIEVQTNDVLKKYEFVIRNNTLESDYEYNSKHYYTTKLDTSDIVIPEEIKKEAKDIYFLVEEGAHNVYFKGAGMMNVEADMAEVEKEYNYKKVEYKDGKTEYKFYNKDLVKDFEDDEYINVQITLIAEFSDTEKLPISNTEYISIGDKKSVLNKLNNEKNGDDSYFGYYNSNDLENYLEELSEKMTRNEYKNILDRADKKITASVKKTEENIKQILKEIKKESDFEKKLETYVKNSETQNLLNTLQRAVKNQIQNVRAYDAIDAIFK